MSISVQLIKPNDKLMVNLMPNRLECPKLMEVFFQNWQISNISYCQFWHFSDKNWNWVLFLLISDGLNQYIQEVSCFNQSLKTNLDISGLTAGLNLR